MFSRLKMSVLIAIIFCLRVKLCVADDSPLTKRDMLEMQSLKVNGEVIPIAGKTKVRLSASPENIIFNFGFSTNASRRPIRLRRKLEGFDGNWNIGGGAMFL